MGRSATNVIGNSLATAVVAKWEGELAPEHALGPDDVVPPDMIPGELPGMQAGHAYEASHGLPSQEMRAGGNPAGRGGFAYHGGLGPGRRRLKAVPHRGQFSVRAISAVLP